MKEGLIAKSVTEKNNSRVDCAEAGKKTVQAQHFGRLSDLRENVVAAELLRLTRRGEDF